MKSIRILQFISHLGLGGAQRMMFNLMIELNRQGLEVAAASLYGPDGGELERRLREEKFQTWYLAKRPGFDPRILHRIRDVVRQFRPHLVHSHLCLHYLFPSLLDHRAVAHVTTVHLPALTRHKQLMRGVARMAYWQGVVPVAVSDDVAEWVESICAVRNCAVIPNGIPIANYRRSAHSREAWRRENGFQESDVLYVCAARLAKQKNHAMLVEAFAHGPARHHSAHLLLAGEGECRLALEAQIRQLRLPEKVHFLGRREDVCEILAGADVFVLASHTEGNPLSLMEAMAAGLPIVATAVGGVPEIVEDRKHGLLVKSHDSLGMAMAMVGLLQDRGARLAMGSAASQRAEEEFSAARMARAYAKLYEQLLHRSRTVALPCGEAILTN